MSSQQKGGIIAIVLVLFVVGFALFQKSSRVVSNTPTPNGVSVIQQATSSAEHYQLVDEQIGANTVVQQDQGGAAAWGADVKIPDNLPTELPLYSGAHTKAAVTTGEARASLVQTTGDSVEVAVGKVTAQMRAKGFVLKQDTPSNGKRSMVFESSAWRVNVDVALDPFEGTVISSVRTELGQ